MTKCIKCFFDSKIAEAYRCVIKFSDLLLLPAFLLFLRYWMAQVFWYSGLTKINSWQNTIYLFKFEYQVPIIPAEIAAYLATSAELAAPVFLLFGLMSRLMCIPLLCIVAVIQFTYLEAIEHIYWAILLGCILLIGPGKFSLDYILSEIGAGRSVLGKRVQKSELEGVPPEGHIDPDGERGQNN